MGVSLGMCLHMYELSKIKKQSPMALLLSPHPSPLFRTSLAIAKPAFCCRSPSKPSHRRRTPRTSSNLSGPSSIPCSHWRLVLPSSNLFRRLRTCFAVFKLVSPSSNSLRHLQTLLPLWNPSGRRQSLFAVFGPVSLSSLSCHCRTCLA